MTEHVVLASRGSLWDDTCVGTWRRRRQSCEDLRETIPNRRGSTYRSPEMRALGMLFREQQGHCGWSLKRRESVAGDQVYERVRDPLTEVLVGPGEELGHGFMQGRLPWSFIKFSLADVCIAACRAHLWRAHTSEDVDTGLGWWIGVSVVVVMRKEAFWRNCSQSLLMDWTDEKYQEQLLAWDLRNWLDAGAICSDRKAQGRIDFGRSSGDVGKQVLCAGPS